MPTLNIKAVTIMLVVTSFIICNLLDWYKCILREEIHFCLVEGPLASRVSPSSEAHHLYV